MPGTRFLVLSGQIAGTVAALLGTGMLCPLLYLFFERERVTVERQSDGAG